MDEKRKAEIATLMVKGIIKSKGMTFGGEFQKKMEEAAFDIGVPPEELLEFLKPLVLEVVNEAFAPK